MNPAAKLDDIAAKVGVSKATVSRVLTNGPHNRVSPKTRSAILATARQLDYRPNLLARGLVKGVLPFLGVVVPEMMNLHFPRIIEGIDAEAVAAGFQTVVNASRAGDGVDESTKILALSHKVSGLIVCPSNRSGTVRKVGRTIQQAPVPVIQIERPVAGRKIPSVIIDHKKGGELGCRWMINAHCDRLVFAIYSRRNSPAIWHPRLAGFQEAAHARGLTVEPCILDTREGKTRLRNALRCAKRPGIFFNTYLTLTKYIRFFQKEGIRLPRSTRICGFDEGVWGLRERDVSVFLTSLACWPAAVTYSEFEIGRSAARMMLAKINHGSWPQMQTVIPVELETAQRHA